MNEVVSAADQRTSKSRSASKPKKRKRSELTDAQRRVIVGICSIAALASLFVDCTPTGTVFYDAVYRAMFVVVMVLAGSRARRWALVSAAMLCALCAVSWFLVTAAAALILAAVLVGADTRHRAFGAIGGGLVGFSALGLNVGFFTGLSTIVALVAAVIVCLSGYRNASRHPRKLVRRVTFACGAFWGLGILLGGITALVTAPALRTAATETRDGIDLVRNGESEQATEALGRATTSFDRATSRSSGPWTWIARAVPVVGQNVRVVATVSEQGGKLVDVAQRAVGDINYDELTLPEGGVDVEKLVTLSDPVNESLATLQQTQRRIEETDSPWTVWLLRRELDTFTNEVDDLTRESELASLAIDRSPSLLGANGIRNYLVLLGNPAEARDVGGHIGNWAHVQFNNGKMNLVDVGVPLDLSNPSEDARLQLEQLYPASLISMQPGKYPQNWGSSPDFDASAVLASELFAKKTGTEIHGVMYADPFVLASLLGITGPIDVPSSDLMINQGNAVRFLTHDQFVTFPDSDVGNLALTGLISDMFEKLTESELPGPKELGDLFGQLTRDRRMRFVSMNSDDRPLMEKLGLSVTLPTGYNHDLFGVITRNANPSKIDSFLERSTKYDVDWNDETGLVEATATVTLTNTAPAVGEPDLVIGNQIGQPLGTNATTLAIITPFEATSVEQDGAPISVSPVFEGSWWRHTVSLRIAPESSVTVTFKLSGDILPTSSYSVFVIGQPLINPGDIDINVQATSREFVDTEDIDAVGRDVSVTVPDIGDSFAVFATA